MEEGNMERKYLGNKMNYKIVANKRVNTLFEKALQYYFVNIVAGPGFGKSEMLKDFVKNYEGRLVWFSLSRIDNVSTVFWEDFIQSLRWELPDLANEISKTEFPLTLADFTAFYRDFAKNLYNGEQVLLVVDNYYYMYTPEIKSFFEYLINAQLENLCIIIIDHKKTDIMLNNELVFRVTANDLAFTKEEVKMFFEGKGIYVSEGTVEHFYKRSAGWPLALALVATHIEKGTLKGEYYGDLTDIDFSDIFELFEKYFFSNYSSDIQDFLIKASLVNQFSLDIVSSTGNYNDKEIESVIYNNSFISFNPQNKVFTLHTSYRDFLKHKQEKLKESEIKTFLSLIADYYYNHRNFIKAIQYYRESELYDKMENAIKAQLIAYPEKDLQRKFANAYFFLQQFKLMPREYINRSYFLRIIEASVYYVHSMFDKVEVLCNVMEKDLKNDDTPQAKIYLGELYLLMAETCIMRKRLGFYEYYKNGQELLPKGSKIKDGTFFAIGNNSIFFLLNKYDKKTNTYQPSGAQGELKKIEEEFLKAQPYMKKAMNGFTAGLAYLYAAEGAYFSSDFSKTTKMAFRAIYEALEQKQHDIYCNAHFIQAKVGLVHGNLDEMQFHIEEIIHYIDSHKLINLYEMRDCISSWFSTTLGMPEDNVPWIKEGRYYNRKVFLLYVGRDMHMHAYYLLHTKQYERLLSFSSYFRELVVENGVWFGQIGTLIYKAICYNKLGEKEKALKSFKEAYHMGYHNNLIMPFVECGSEMRGLLKFILEGNDKTLDMKWISMLYSKSSTFAKRKSSMTKEYVKKNKLADKQDSIKISKREQEILQCLAQGLTREEIGVFYNLSANTVKRHITNLYNKLGAINRADAIYIAAMKKML